METKKQIGKLLGDAGIISDKTMERALKIQKESDKRLGALLGEMDIVSEEVTEALAGQFNLRTVKNFANKKFSKDLLDLVPVRLALGKTIFYQWDIFWADLDPSKGSEQAGPRPVLVISTEEVNQELPIVSVLILTSVKTGRKEYPTETFLEASVTGLPNDSIAMSHQIRAISKERLGERCGSIADEAARERINAAIKTDMESMQNRVA